MPENSLAGFIPLALAAQRLRRSYNQVHRLALIGELQMSRNGRLILVSEASVAELASKAAGTASGGER